MSLGLTKPGLRSVDLSGKKHPITGLPIEPIGHMRDGTAVWPVMGGSEDEDDPDFTGEGGTDDDSDDEDEDDEDEPKGKKKPVKKTKGKADDSDDDEDDEDEPKLTRPERQAARYRVKLRAAEAANRELSDRLKALEDKDKKPDEIAERDTREAREKADRLAERVRSQNLRLAFYESNSVDWVDPADALKLVDLEDVDVDEDGTVDPVQLRKALRALAKSKPHLVKKPKVEPDADDEDEDDEPRSRRSASPMNSSRRGKGKAPSREDLAKKFPVLGRR